MKKYLASLIIAVPLVLAGCGDELSPTVTAEKNGISEVRDNSEDAVQNEPTTAVTKDNYALAETQVIFSSYVQRIAAATDTNGVGVWLHNKVGANPKDRTVMRINFDTIYSFAIVDLSEDVALTMPETNGRYQSAWIITEEHYNPMAFTRPGTYTLTRENVGSPYAMIIIRTQSDTSDAADLAAANTFQEKLELKQLSRGSYTVANSWSMDEILAMRAVYAGIGEDEDTQSEAMFGKKGEVPLKEHNIGTAMGWGGLTAERAVYPGYFPDSSEPQTLTLRDVPADAFWSLTVYDEEGYPQGEVYNINSEFAVVGEDGAVIIHFGGDSSATNYMDIYDGWNVVLRIYEPTQAYFNGGWVRPELEMVK